MEGKEPSQDSRSLTPLEKHKKFMRDYHAHTKQKTDFDILNENYKFIRTDGEEESSWEQKLAKKYYDKLFKEYCLADMSRYREGKIGLRWRTEREVTLGKGQFICGNKKCEAEAGLKSYEVNFAYVEEGEQKNALVKLRVCENCAYMLNYKELKGSRKQEKKEKKEIDKRQKKRKLVEDTDNPSPPPPPPEKSNELFDSKSKRSKS